MDSMAESYVATFDPNYSPSLAAKVGSYLVGNHDGRGYRIGIACGRFNGGITVRLLEAALGALYETGVERSDVTVAWAPGAFELPFLARCFATTSRPVDAIIALGAVIRGDTGHYEVVSGECARGIQHVQLTTGVPVVFGVLTTNNLEQALDRSRDDDTNKGRESALAALEMLSVTRQGPLAR